MAEVGPDVTPPVVPPIAGGKIQTDGVTINILGRQFHGWKSVRVTKHIESVCNEFSIVLDDRFGNPLTGWPLKPDIPIDIGIGPERVFTGFIEVAEPSFTPDSRSFTISGRSKPGDLVDCTHEGLMEFQGVTPEQLATQLVKPFLLRVFTSVISKPIKKFAVKPGETVFEALDRAARMQGFFWVSTRGGNIRLTRAARLPSFSGLSEDVNITSGRAVYDGTKRFSNYTVKGQSEGGLGFFGPAVAQPIGVATDAGAKRYRPLTVLAEDSIDVAKAQERAQWEAASRLAKMARVEVTTNTWRQLDGSLWGINQVVPVASSFLGINRLMLSARVEHFKDNNGGTQTTLTLVHPDAYNPLPVANAVPGQDMFDTLGVGGGGAVLRNLAL